MSAILILVISIAALLIAYVTYGSWLAKKWGIDPSRKTPAYEYEDGVDYVPAKAPVLLGHHFASIAGAGPINGPIQAAVFGWVPVLLWVLIGGIFFGAVQDFSALFVSIRNKGKSIGAVIESTIGQTGKRLFIIFVWLTLILVIAAFADVVASSFVGTAVDEAGAYTQVAMANGSTATASMLFIALAIIFGFVVYRKNAPLLVSSIIGVALLCVCIGVGLAFPLHVSKTIWLVFTFIYIAIASVTPVWILLQPRDYLNSFLLYGMIILAVVGIFCANPTITLPAFTGFTVNGQTLFPFLFITIACGAISGFHSLIASGTTAKQLSNERDAKKIGYGAMLIECVLAVLALIAVGALYNAAEGAMPAGAPPVVFAQGIAQFCTTIGLPYNTVNTIITLAVSAFALTSLDTCARLGRYMFQEFFQHGSDEVTGFRKALTNPVVATVVTVGAGAILATVGYQNIWPLFGAANQLLAALALLAVAVWFGAKGKSNKVFLLPAAFMTVCTVSALVLTIINNCKLYAAGTATFAKQGLQIIFAALLTVLAIVLVIQGVSALIRIAKHKFQPAEEI